MSAPQMAASSEDAAQPTPRRTGILHVLPTLNSGGAENMACLLMTATARLHEIGVVSFYGEANSWVEQDLKAAHIPMWHLDKKPGFDPRMFTRFDRAMGDFRPDVVHTHMSVLRYALPSLVRNRVPLTIHTLHNLASHETDVFGRALQWFLFRGVVVPVAISPEVAGSFERYYKLRCPHIIPNCIPVEVYRSDPLARERWRAKEGIPQDAIVFTSTSRFEPQKNPLLMLEAFAGLKDSRARLVLMGRGYLEDQIVSFIRDHGLQRSVHMLGYRPDVPECLGASDVFLLSSDWEGNPLAVMEALASGLPVISTSVGGVPSLVESGCNGILVARRDCTAFAEAMRFLLDDAVSRAAMSCVARSRAVAEFSLDRMVRGYCDLYETASR